MYKVFVNESPLILTNVRPDNNAGNVFPMEDEAINYAITALSKKILDEAYIYAVSYTHLTLPTIYSV